MSRQILEAAAATKRFYARRRRRKLILYSALSFVVGLSIGSIPSFVMEEGWYTETPPSERPIHVMTKGWYDDGKFYSYDCGEEITVHQWRP